MGSKFSHSSCPAPSCVYAQKRIPLHPEMSSGQFLGKAALRGALRNSKLLRKLLCGHSFFSFFFFFFCKPISLLMVVNDNFRKCFLPRLIADCPANALAASVSFPTTHIYFSGRRHSCVTEPQAIGPEGTSKFTKSILPPQG